MDLGARLRLAFGADDACVALRPRLFGVVDFAVAVEPVRRRGGVATADDGAALVPNIDRKSFHAALDPPVNLPSPCIYFRVASNDQHNTNVRLFG